MKGDAAGLCRELDDSAIFFYIGVFTGKLAWVQSWI